jgi:hypothetical protein
LKQIREDERVTSAAPASAGPDIESTSAPPAVDIPWGKYEFADFGCSSGGSLKHCLKRFGARSGVGIDIDSDKIAKARAAGCDAMEADLHALSGRKAVRFVSMMQFLEHLPGLEDVERVIAKAASLATDFLYIHHPSFDDEEYLRSQGLMLYYQHWSGHTAHILRDDFFEIFERLDLLQYHVRPIQPVESSDHESIIPVEAGINQHQYDLEKHGDKPSIQFPRPIYQHMEFFVALRPFTPEEWRSIVVPG